MRKIHWTSQPIIVPKLIPINGKNINGRPDDTETANNRLYIIIRNNSSIEECE